MRTSPALVIGILLVAVGVIVLGWQGITYTTRETVVDIGVLKVTQEREKTLPLPPILGAVALAAGVALIVSTRRG